MPETILVKDHDVHSVKVAASDAVEREIHEFFSFDAPGAKFHPKVRSGLWDGKIKLWNYRTKLLPFGLKGVLAQFAADNEYELVDLTEDSECKVTDQQIDQFWDSLNIPERFDRRDYQTEMLRIAAEQKRAILLCPTSGGKSLSIYQIARWFNQKTLVVVPTTTLVSQLATDFADYGYTEPVGQIMAGQDKEKLPLITVTTWQSAFEMPPKWFAQFKTIIGDEAHTFNAKSLQKILDKSVANVRIGLTGSLSGAKVHELNLQGMFGKITRVATTRELIDAGYAADLLINAITLDYPKEFKKQYTTTIRELAKTDKKEQIYNAEIDMLLNYEKRNKLIITLASKLEGNCLILFRKVDHGKELYQLGKQRFQHADLIYGEVDTKIREDVRRFTETIDDARIFASFRTFATGINIKNLHHVIFASPLKSKILLIQAVGRALRISENKTKANIWDLGDNLSSSAKQNYAYSHFISRLREYTSEQFEIKFRRIQL